MTETNKQTDHGFIRLVIKGLWEGVMESSHVTNKTPLMSTKN